MQFAAPSTAIASSVDIVILLVDTCSFRYGGIERGMDRTLCSAAHREYGKSELAEENAGESEINVELFWGVQTMRKNHERSRVSATYRKEIEKPSHFQYFNGYAMDSLAVSFFLFYRYNRPFLPNVDLSSP